MQAILIRIAPIFIKPVPGGMIDGKTIEIIAITIFIHRFKRNWEGVPVAHGYGEETYRLSIGIICRATNFSSAKGFKAFINSSLADAVLSETIK